MSIFSDWIYKHTGISLNYQPVLESEHILYVLAILLKIGSADGDTSPEEVAGVVAIASKRFGDNSKQGIEKVLESFKATSELSTTELIDELAQNLSLEQKSELLSLAYRVAKLDKNYATGEKQLINSLKERLEIPDDLAAEAYQKALEELS